MIWLLEAIRDGKSGRVSSKRLGLTKIAVIGAEQFVQ